MVLILLLLISRSPVELNVALEFYAKTNGKPSKAIRKQWGPLVVVAVVGFSLSDLRCPSPSQILGTSSRFSLKFSRIHFLPLRSKGRKSILEKWVLRRNCYIESVLLFEADSVVLLPGCLESSG